MNFSDAISKANALKCSNLLKEYFSAQTDNLAFINFPKEITYASDAWLTYMFYSCLLDYGMRSKIYHQNLINTYSKHPEIFNPKYIIDNNQNLLDILKNNVHPRYPNIALKKWLTLSNELAKYDDLLTTIKSFKNFNELNEFVKKTKCYGQKTGGLLLRTIVDSRICNFEDLDFIPLDRHDIEISYLNNIVSTKKLSSKEINNLSTAWIESAKKVGISPSDIDKYLWEIGSQFCNHKKCLECPLNKTCQTKQS